MNGSVLIACDHAQNQSLTYCKECAPNCYSPTKTVRKELAGYMELAIHIHYMLSTHMIWVQIQPILAWVIIPSHEA